MKRHMISITTLSTLILGLVLADPARALDPREEDGPIDAYLEKCQEGDPSTHGMVRCIDQALELWDAQLNRVYGELMALLDRGGQQALRQAQRRWIAFRDGEYGTIRAVYSRTQGTLYIPLEAYSRMKITKRRVQDLEHYVEIIRGSR